MSDYFLLDPDYKDFPDKQKLKFLTVYGEQHTYIVLAVFLLTVYGIFFVYFLFVILPREYAYLRNGINTLAVVTESCQPSHNWYVYSFEAQDKQGNPHQYLGKTTPDKNTACPKVGDSVMIKYVSDQPELLSRETNGSSNLLNIFGLGSCLCFPLLAFWITHRDIRAFIQARPKYTRLEKSTTLLDGIIFSVRDTKNANVTGRARGYYIEVEYEFLFNYQIFRGTQLKRREDLAKKSLPEPGTPVRVLYADETPT